ncbi:hypothetical protein CE497_25695 [Salmonella enterica subsp. enterica serovar Typhimurium]|nr:hypothetical protein CE497_25695 [Salmonella enterica subsp. enterica serovar Typhimurium]
MQLVIVAFIWEKILFCGVWWAEDGLLCKQLDIHQATIVGFILIVIVIAKRWGCCGLIEWADCGLLYV